MEANLPGPTWETRVQSYCLLWGSSYAFLLALPSGKPPPVGWDFPFLGGAVALVALALFVWLGGAAGQNTACGLLVAVAVLCLAHTPTYVIEQLAYGFIPDDTTVRFPFIALVNGIGLGCAVRALRRERRLRT